MMVPDLARSRSSDLGGIIAMVAATAAFVVGDSFMKIVIEDLPPFEVLFLRGIAASIACAGLVTVRSEWGAISGLFDVRTLLRAAGETLTTLCYVAALARMSIADVHRHHPDRTIACYTGRYPFSAREG